MNQSVRTYSLRLAASLSFMLAILFTAVLVNGSSTFFCSACPQQLAADIDDCCKNKNALTDNDLYFDCCSQDKPDYILFQSINPKQDDELTTPDYGTLSFNSFFNNSLPAYHTTLHLSTPLPLSHLTLILIL